MDKIQELPASKWHRIEIKVSKKQKDVISQAADLSRKGISELVLDAAEREARNPVEAPAEYKEGLL